MDFEDSLRLLQDSDERRQQADDGTTRHRGALARSASVLTRLPSEPPRRVETVLLAQERAVGETEVRSLAGDALHGISTDSAGEGAEAWPMVRVRPLSRPRGIDVDGFEFDDPGAPVGRTVALLSDVGDTVHPVAPADADRRLMSSLLPSRLARLGS